MNSTACWNALYTRANCEGKVSRLLKKKGIKFYCPHNSTPLEGSQEKWVTAPLFRSVIFVQVADSETLFSLRTLTNVLNVVYWQQRPASIPAKEIEALRHFLEAHVTVQSVKISLNILDVSAAPITHHQYTTDNGYTIHLPHIGYSLLAKAESVTNVKLVRKIVPGHKATDSLALILGFKINSSKVE